MDLEEIKSYVSIYLEEIKRELLAEEATELTYRSFLKKLIESIIKESYISEERKNVKGTGRPDYTSFFKNIKIGYIETKDIDIDLEKELFSDQINKYMNGAIPNLILTNYLHFMLVRNDNGKHACIFDVNLSNLRDMKIKKTNLPIENILKLSELFQSFFNFNMPVIKDSYELSFELAKRTKLLRMLVKEQLEFDLIDLESGLTPTNSIYEFYLGFREIVNDADIELCVNAYSETITYGIFLAKIHSIKTKLDRNNSHIFIPSNIMIIKKIFLNITGDELPDNVTWIIDEIIEILNLSDMEKIISNFSMNSSNYRDPFTHFYEDFLEVYDPERRDQLGVYYTPDPVVYFITTSVNILIKQMFHRQSGFASSDVTLLDPCLGTGTFLAKAFVTVLDEIKNQYQGAEVSVIREHLLKNFMGFEISIAPYIISHLKLNLILNNVSYYLDKNERTQVYLTNTLDTGEMDGLGPFMGVLSSEIKNANEIKIKLPIMTILGNPPYFKRSANKSYWILNLLEDYKRDLNEKRLGNLDDDYVKFIRFAQWKIEQNEHGIIGFITNNSFIDNTTFRKMRQSLSETFNYIYILNLHGDSNLKEVTPDGQKDENVFDIQQGVSISFFIKIKESTEHHLFYYDLWGSRSNKYSFLHSNDINSIKWKEIPTNQKYYLFKPLPVTIGEKYEEYIPINKIFNCIISGLETKKDKFIVNFTKKDLVNKLNKFVSPHYTDEEIKKDLSIDDIIIKDSKGEKKYEFKVSDARNAVSKEGIQDNLIRPYNYRPFDTRWIYFSSKCVSRTRQPLSNTVNDEDLCLSISRMTKSSEFSSILVANGLVDWKYCEYSRGCYFIPLYVPKEENEKLIKPEYTWKGKNPNFTTNFIRFLKAHYEKIPEIKDIFNYVYAMLYSRAYRQKYKDYLKIDFPRIPFVKDLTLFIQLSKLGCELINLHSLKNMPNNISFKFLGNGSDNTIKNIKWKDNKIWINQEKFYDGITKNIWNFEIGGYPVISKWLKSRKNRCLSYSEIQDLLNIINVINETNKIMDNIESITEKLF